MSSMASMWKAAGRRPAAVLVLSAVLGGLTACGGDKAGTPDGPSDDSVFGEAPQILPETPNDSPSVSGKPVKSDSAPISKVVVTDPSGGTSVPPVYRPPVSSGGAAGPTGSAEVRFETAPAGATVVLRQGKSTFTGPTPFVAKVPPGTYTWSISKEGFLPDSSGSGGLQLVAAPRTVSVQLMNANDWSGIADKADAAFQAGTCEQAVPLYRTLDRPRERVSRMYERWTESRMRLARCSQRINDPAGAVEALKSLRDDNPGGVNWRAVYELGLAQCSNLSFTEGRRTFGELDGQIRNRVASENRPAMRALAYYGRAYCGFQDFDNRTGTPPQSLVTALDDDFERFFKTAETAREQGAMSPEVNKLLNEAVSDAEAMRKRLPDR